MVKRLRIKLLVELTPSVIVAAGVEASSVITLPKPDQLIVAIPSISKSKLASLTQQPSTLYIVLEVSDAAPNTK